MNRLYITYLIAIFFICFATSTLLAQEEVPDNRIAIVKLKSGTTVEGEIIEWKFGESISLKFPWGGKTIFYQEQIKKIQQKSSIQPLRIPSNRKEEGIYYNARIHLITGNEGPRAHGVFGYGLALSAGHRFNRFLGIGGGIAYDRYIWDSGENLIPLFAEINGFLNKSNTSLFYNMAAGYSFASTDEKYLLSEAHGGLMLFPSIGISWGTQSFKYSLTAGYKFQFAEFRYDSPWTFGEYSHHDVLFKRLSLSFGIIL